MDRAVAHNYAAADEVLSINLHDELGPLRNRLAAEKGAKREVQHHLFVQIPTVTLLRET